MAIWNAKVDLYIDGADQDDAWAQGIVEWVVDQVATLSAQAKVVGGLSAEERQSYAMAGSVDGSGVLQVTKSFIQTTGGAVQASEWQVDTAYAVDDRVTYGGSTYVCIQAHTSQVGWEPPNVPALWSLV